MTEEQKSGNVDTRVKTIGHLVDVVCKYRDNWIDGSKWIDPWFRGHADTDWDLKPSIFRYRFVDDEDELREQFERRAPQYVSEPPPADTWGWYFLMQHYGAPTRLLDWTDSVLVGLFFALNPPVKPPREDDEEEEPKDAAVWMLDPWWLNQRVLGTDCVLAPHHTKAEQYLAPPQIRLDANRNTQILEEYPAAIDPPFIAKRIASQRSRFTVFGWAQDGLMRLRNEANSRIVKIVIPKDKVNRMRADLFTLGISDAVVYPDLRGLSEELIRYRLGNWPPD
jgi:hypothetical protein